MCRLPIAYSITRRFCGEENREKQFYAQRKKREAEYRAAVANRATLAAMEAVKVRVRVAFEWNVNSHFPRCNFRTANQHLVATCSILRCPRDDSALSATGGQAEGFRSIVVDGRAPLNVSALSVLSSC